MCRGSEAAAVVQETVETPTKYVERETTEEPDDELGDLTPGSGSSDLAPPSFENPQPSDDSPESSEWSPSLPVRALQSRLQPHGAAPRWAAWLPANLHQASYTGSSVETVPCEDMAQMMPAEGLYGGSVDMCQQWVTPDGVILQPVVFYTGAEVGDSNWGDAGTEAQYYQYSEEQFGQEYYQWSGVQPEQEYAQLSEPLREDDASSIRIFAGRVWKLSQDGKGCRQLQDAFDVCNDEERITLASELRGHVWQALKCGNANHVIQKCITTMKPASVQFIINELTHNGTGGAAHAARHRFGCRIIERLLEHCSAEQLSPLVEELLAEGAVLSGHIYGYYVMQHLLEHGPIDVAAHISTILEENLPFTAPDSYAGAVIGTALGTSTNTGAGSLAKALLKDTEHAAMMACSRWGYTAVKLAFQLVEEPLRSKFATELSWYSNRLRSNRYGRLVASAIAEQHNLPITWMRGSNRSSRGIVNKAFANHR